MNAAPKTLRHLSRLNAAGLTPAGKRAALEQVAAHYAVAVTPAMAELIDPPIRTTRSRGSSCPTPPSSIARPDERADPIGDDAHSPVEGIVHRYPDRVLLKLTHRLRGLLPLLLPPRNGRPGRASRCRASELDAALGYIAAHPEIWEVDPDRRRPAGAVAAAARGRGGAARRDRARQGDPRAHAACRSPIPQRVTPELVAALKARGQGDLRGAARQPSARTDARGARGLRASDRCRHPDAEPVGAAGRRQRRSADARSADARVRRMPHQAVLPAPRRSRARHLASSHLDRARPGADARRCAAACPACASRTTCSTFPAATASRRSARTTSRTMKRAGPDRGFQRRIDATAT